MMVLKFIILADYYIQVVKNGAFILYKKIAIKKAY